MSERISWETCPECGSRVAVGWRPRGSESMPGPWEEPVEADCLNGCTLTAGQLQRLGIPLGADPLR